LIVDIGRQFCPQFYVLYQILGVFSRKKEKKDSPQRSKKMRSVGVKEKSG